MNPQTATSPVEALIKIRQMTTGYWVSQALHVVALNNIADHLKSGPQTAEELAEHAKLNSAALHRVLRALASVGFFEEDAHHRFALTPVGEFLREDHPMTQKYFILMITGAPYLAWEKLNHSVATGNPAFQAAFGMPMFEYLTKHPQEGRIFDAAMTGVHGVETEPMIDAYDFSAFKTVTDIGGGNGLVLAAVLNRHPHLKGILFDLPPVVEGAKAVLPGTGVAERIRIEGGDFFHGVAKGADAYILRHIVHDWSDEDAAAILRNCREAMNKGGKVLIVETVVPEGNDPSLVKWLDLMMLTIGGKERTREQYKLLLESAGLKLTKIVPTATEVSVIEAVAA